MGFWKDLDDRLDKFDRDTDGARQAVNRKIHGYYSSLLRPMAQENLLAKLSSIVKTARDHETNNLPTGSDEYKSLYEHANRLVTEFSIKYDVPRGELEAQLLELQVLRSLTITLATPESPKASGFLLTAVMTTLLIVAAIGILYGIFHSAARLFGG